ncbi:hypothetical protein LTR99_002272 [Exophiala xenobiotica]|uniref:C2 domain-containing protein n=1 Tax=Vermiconidia calcicola TaxID=1690605 RepID=A0AAV9QFG5_9PEZI|nr:hypothetical protein H2202_000649 [Exophiala xenobiotica]KAK5542391.1 hypothetical protein LTR25_002276 [Vermiconidia calcicola]KAK5546249.1 hypothetical protein LTR23_003700 [Chaetothyriales sp. CCFEE 6169]KAK5210077.1 hypothetical protein LTR41_004709 [Exophiala xenobiotica]KAK5225949.1 hypothetical protein LTR72_003852 [Exophiala xenobiotica]
MPDNDADAPVLRKEHPTDKIGPRLVNEADKLQSKYTGRAGTGTSEKKGPAGGYDDTPVPHAPPGYTLKITFHKAENLPFADLGTLSSDPYILAVLKSDLPKRHKQDPDLTLRTPTIHRSTSPEWNTDWIVANVPKSGFYLKCRLYDEDPSDHDDRLGNVHINISNIDDNWEGFSRQSFDLKKRMGSKRAYTFRGCAALFSRDIKMDGHLIVSVENLGRTKDESGGRMYTIGPLTWSRHYSPLIGRLAGTKNTETSKDGKETQKYNFQAIQIQLRGPVPADLYHRYVEFKPFVAGMFTSHSIRGRLLNRALHHQHARIYNYDQTTKYGTFTEPNVDMTKLFLDLVHYDEGGRIFTYVLTLDGLLRFTETGKEFGIDLLSKHTMHSDVSIYIACSGEFFIRKVRHAKSHQDEKTVDPLEGTHKPAPESGAEEEERENAEIQQMSMKMPGDDEGNQNEKSDPKCPVHSAVRNYKDGKDKDKGEEAEVEGAGGAPSKDTEPSHYELIIDNDSGTYRPNAKKLGMLRDFLASNFPSLKVVTLDCQGDEERMKKLKDEQRERKKKSSTQVMFMQNNSMSSISSSDEEYLDARAAGNDPKESRYKREYHKFMDGGRDQHHGGDRAGTDAAVANGQVPGGMSEKENGETVHGMGRGNGAVGANANASRQGVES